MTELEMKTEAEVEDFRSHRFGVNCPGFLVADR